MDNSQIPSTPLFPPGQCCPPKPSPDYGCPVPGCPVPGHDYPPPCPPPHKPPYPDPHDPGYWASDGDWPLPPEGGKCPPPPPPKTKHNCDCHDGPTVVPPPIPPVRYVPGMDVQEQLCKMANHVNMCVDRWNQIQANCYEALNRVVGAAVSNDVYYEPDEVRFSTGYSSADGSNYEIIEARPVDKRGCPIVMRLGTAYNSGNRAVRQSILEASFVTSANALVTAVSPATSWRGLCISSGNPVATVEAQEGDWLAGWTKRGVLRLLPATETTIESACRNQITDCIGPVIPIVMNGKPTQVAADYPAEPGAIQAIGWKQCNGNKVIFSCGFQDEPGCTVKNVADLLVSMGVTTAAVTCYMNAYGTGNMGPFIKEDENDSTVNSVTADNNSGIYSISASPLNNHASVTNVVGQSQAVSSPVGVVPEPWVNQEDTINNDILGLTGGMAYIGHLADRPLQYQIPSNSAFWIITKRPTKAGWPNRWTGEIADICQRLGANATELDSVQGKLDIEQVQILDLQQRVGKLETNDKEQDQKLKEHETRICSLENRMDMAETDIQQLQEDLTEETRQRIAEDAAIREVLQQETDNRIDEDNKLNDRVNQLRNALTEEITARNQADQDLSNSILNEVNARIAGDTQLSTKIDMTKIEVENKITQEASKREEKDTDLQNQIDALEKDVSKINLKTGMGLRETVSSTGTRNIEAYLGPGMRFNALEQIVPNIGGGLQILGGILQPKLSDCFTINEEGEITMACCESNKLPIAGTGVDYGVDPQTGDVILNVQPPKDGNIGGVKAGSGVTISPDGTISANGGGGGEPYTLPPATNTTLGGVIVGDNLTVTDDGKLSASSDYVLPVASPTVLGGVRVGKNLVIDVNGVLNAELPDMPAGEGDTVLAGTGIDVTKNAGERTATVALNEETLGTLAQVGDNKNAIDSVDNRVTQLANSTVSNTLFQTTVQGINQNVSKAQGDANAAQTTADQANAAASDAATLAAEAKKIADNATAAFVNALPLSGGTMTGDINFATTARSVEGRPTVKGLPTPTEPDEAANKKYVDDAVAGADTSGLMPKSGGTFTGNVTMGDGTKLNGIVNPTSDSEAANKAYVDSLKTDIAAANTTAEAASSKADSAASQAATAIAQSGQAVSAATEAKNTADQANTTAEAAETTATEAKTTAEAANSTASSASTVANEAKEAIDALNEGGPYLPTSGGSLSGALTVNDSAGYATSSTIDGSKITVSGTPGNGNFDNYKIKLIKNGQSVTAEYGNVDTSTSPTVVSGISTPIADTDAANKKYVDDAVAGASPTGDYLPLSGGTLTGSLFVNNSGSSSYIKVDGDKVSVKNTNTFDNTGVILNQNTSGGAQRLSLIDSSLHKGLFNGDESTAETTGTVLGGVMDPQRPYDAANKQYVDSHSGGQNFSAADNTEPQAYINNGLHLSTYAVTSGGTTFTYMPIFMENTKANITTESDTSIAFAINSPGSAKIGVVNSNTYTREPIKLTGIANPINNNDAVNKSYATPAGKRANIVETTGFSFSYLSSPNKASIPQLTYYESCNKIVRLGIATPIMRCTKNFNAPSDGFINIATITSSVIKTLISDYANYFNPIGYAFSGQNQYPISYRVVDTTAYLSMFTFTQLSSNQLFYIYLS